MKLLVLFCISLFSSVALAVTGDAQVTVYDAAISLLGEKGQFAVMVVCLVGYGWAMLRQFIKPEKLSWLPEWAINLLEFFAANRGYAKNLHSNDPRYMKSVKPK
ncbi:hypothetical protein L3Q72_06635 [Vibrio sp. JC009]|uniref:hypothetical protein n=1 Tax=Vibrio sp. JC009 TaxID=2912314 RepID=UPI0023B02A41|nr:hypothetical protein [Vibrio sp. JC009]WED23064.1 hypothetical protein L3Q72_06635 [Vibrio sp. JC009]